MRATAPDPLALALDRLIEQRSFDIHFQPLVAIDRAEIFGFEALTRGPADGPLHSPLVLFEAAARLGRLVELEHLIVQRALQRFKQLGLPGQLFLNVTADTLLGAREHAGRLAAELAELGLPTSRLVIELTETRPIEDLAQLDDALQALRERGFRVALDDLGEGFASLRRWMQMRPDFVKIDRHFIDGIAQEPLKQQFVRSIVEMAATSGCEVVAEGLEQEPDLDVLRRLGLTICQGYLFARPSATPRASLGAQWSGRLAANAQPRLLQNDLALTLGQGAITMAAQLARRGRTVTAAANCRSVVDLFHGDEQLLAIPVLDEQQRPIGVLRSLHVLKRSTERYFMDIFDKRSCVELMDRNPLVFDVATPLRAMSDAVSNLDERLLIDGFIVTRDGAYFGSGRSSDLLKAVSDLQVHAARYANPLTLLPGNVPIDNHLDRLIEAGETFATVVWDIDHFKPFNDIYGYRIGDDIIRLAARVLTQAADPQVDFVGHIGGDDFVMVLGSADWEARLSRICEDFDAGVRSFFSAEHLAAGGYVTLNRQNQPSFHPLPTISAGAVLHLPGHYENSRALAAALAEPKRVAKGRAGGSRFFVDRRQPQRALLAA
ncbi:EAL domain-containing protein (putative c-di-GMP-specific phosphodiesterase class I)/GGDEF domain-containing protein [Pelomonas saccharophila]|uniref:EAL domain-containing protein (Putative c-di-GMP-specific phosphodiesterase class I)/GGDEF domain-containing protein n=1 Tax=Roseateles saccharophilus TaxID=304 RepID=A0ABU1YI92_ROSSA|nr:bifunctional diguanylate cyclase/phosphodiesterase [Roseateles saccharophilus]MDR7268574.1 EAL domain-containing protein (putative c-di-GMP-specific phosphodiesterase class I)/GGDEF domain-containing protein [Roseateles saccharophilus]